MVAFERLLDTLGGALHEVVVRGPESAEVTDISVFDPFDLAEIPHAAVALAPGIDRADATRLLERMGAAGATALIVKPPVAHDSLLVRAAERSGVWLVALSRGTPWGHVIGLLTSTITQENFGLPGEEIGGVNGGDLFAVANAIAAVVDAPVTIEDRQSRLLAYSARQEESDPARSETILSRRVPERIVTILRDAGVFRKLVATDEPLFLPDLPDIQPRTAVAVRVGDELLGSIWVAAQEPMNEERTNLLRDSAKLVALHMLRNRAGADVERRIRTDLMATLLEGRGSLKESALRLGLTNKSYRVIAVGLPPEHRTEIDASRGRLWDSLAMHMASANAGSATVLLGGVVYAILAVDPDPAKSREQAIRLAKGFVARSGLRFEFRIGIGGVVTDLEDLARSRNEADQVLRVLMTSRGNRSVADIDDALMQSLLIQLSDLVDNKASLWKGRLGTLREHDEAHGTAYLKTLWAFLDHLGDVTRAADALSVHTNTMRYRIVKLQELSGMDLYDAEERLSLMLQKRLLEILGG